MVEAKWLGRVPYGEAWALQKELVAARNEDPSLPGQLLLLEHPPVYTLGRSGHEDNLLLDERARQQAGIALYEVDRGGDITYHGPGQLVGYPILNLKQLFAARGYQRPDLHQYLRDIEEILIRALDAFGVRGWRYQGYTGVWVDGGEGPLKIAAIGVKVSSRGISSHGFALNVDPLMSHFAGIIPCGIREHGVTSLSQLLERQMAVVDAIPAVVHAFADVLGVEAPFVAPSLSPYNRL